MASRDQFFSKQWNVGTAVNLAIDPMNAAATGTDDKDGTDISPIQAAREGRPHGRIGTGDEAEQPTTGDDLLPQAQLLRHLSLRALLRDQCRRLTLLLLRNLCPIWSFASSDHLLGVLRDQRPAAL